MAEVRQIREAIIAAIPYETSNYGQSPDPGQVYIPRAHIKALKLESNLIVGARGVGKSFWTAALNAPHLRSILGTSVRELERTQVSVGFSSRADNDAYPNNEVFADLLTRNFEPCDIWRAVAVRGVADLVLDPVPVTDWRTTVDWVRSEPEPVERLMQQADRALGEQGQKKLIVFDALDRTSHDWHMMDSIVRDLLRVVLWLKSYPMIHAKVFLREDQFNRTVTDFPDASKLLATKSELTWEPHDLHGLLWQFLCNAPRQHDGEILRSVYRDILGNDPERRQNVWSLAEEAKREGPKQRELFKALAGAWMGKDRRRGVPYVWAISHLADTRGQTSPRSFLIAIRAAAEDSLEKYPIHNLALYYESVKRGVQKASEIRIAEIAEDYPWAKALCDPLAGLNVPCEFSLIEERWRQQLDDPSAISRDRLPPQHGGRGSSGLFEDLRRLGIFERMKDGRVNMPDLYRVGFGLGRRGGVKPSNRG